MKTRSFGNTAFSVSEIGLGCWQFGGDFGPMGRDTAFRIMQSAVAGGISFFDTADVYGAGRSESILGEFFGGQNARPIMATKFGRDGIVYPNGFTQDDLRRGLDASLQRLGVESLDLVQLHCIPIEELRRGEVFDWLRQAQEEGLIRYFGASVETDEQAAVCLEQPDLSSLQIIFNIFRQKPLRETLPRAKEQGVGIIVRLPLASGLLSGRFKANTKFTETDHRNYNRDGQVFNVGETFAGLPLAKGVELIDELKTMLPEGFDMVDLALRWILDHDAVSVIIPGASSPQQAAKNASASDLPPLDAALHAKLARFYDEKVAANIRGKY
ncbi:MAG: aldo/keto reductase [Gammaproteobacteria bacterium]|nr:aldo/keto reductase [Gammaproteobacteria bacterium]